MSTDPNFPSAALIKVWMRNHSSVPLAGIPQKFIDDFNRAKAVDSGGRGQQMTTAKKYDILPFV